MRRAAALLLVIAAAAAIGGGSANAGFPATKARLVVLSEDGGYAAPALVREDGSLYAFGFPLGIHGSVAMAPDGTRAAMVDTVPVFGITVPALLVSNLIGELQGLPVGAVAGRPAWSPDGTKIAFAGKLSGSWDIYVVALDEGAVPIDLTPTSPAADLEPRWSPDGTKIAFQSDRTGKADVYTMNPDGSAVTDVTGDAAKDTPGDWSPDSKRLVFTSTRTGDGDLYLVSRSGGVATRLTSAPGAETHAAWSPDGSVIAYSTDADGDNEVYEVAPDGSAGRRVTDNVHEDLVEDWQPLKDLTPPVAHALPSSSRRGKVLRFRFRLAEKGGGVMVDLEFGYSTGNGSTQAGSTRSIDSVRPGHVYVIAFPYEAGKGAPSSFRFCVQATDGSANVGKRSCARFHFLPKKKTKRR